MSRHKSKSEHVEYFVGQTRQVKIPPPTREYEFHPDRKFRFDLAWIDYKVAVEIDGGNFTKMKDGSVGGRHVRGATFRKDCEKINSAIELGWFVLRGDDVLVKNGTLLRQLYNTLVRVHREIHG